MNFESIDSYLLTGEPPKRRIVEELLKTPAPPQAQAFLEGMRILGSRTPDLSLIALRLVLSGKTATDEAVVALRSAAEAAKAGPDRDGGRRRYYELLA